MRLTPIMKPAVSLAALAFAALGGTAMAQNQSSNQPMPAPAEEQMTDTAEPADAAMDDASMDVMEPADTTSDVAEEAAQMAGIPTDSPTPVEQAYLLRAGDPTVISNPPVPDTNANRTAFGGPDSNGGRKTRAVGN